MGVNVDINSNVTTMVAYTRSTDYRPFNAGGYMIDPSGHTCSTGFAIIIGSTTHATTARHCRENDYYARNASANKYGGTNLYSTHGQARVLTSTGAAHTFDGAWNNPDGFRKPVQQLADVGLNSYVCTSGETLESTATLK